MFWDRFYSLCVENKTTPTNVVKAIGVSHGATTKWKKGTNPNADVLVKLAEYFNVSIDYLMGLTNYRNEILKRIDFDNLEQYDDNSRGAASFKEVLGTEKDFEILEEFLKQKGIRYYISDKTPYNDKKNKATPEEQPLTDAQAALLNYCSDLSNDDLEKVIDYIELLKLKNNATQKANIKLVARSGEQKEIETSQEDIDWIASSLNEDTTSDY